MLLGRIHPPDRITPAPGCLDFHDGQHLHRWVRCNDIQLIPTDTDVASQQPPPSETEPPRNSPLTAPPGSSRGGCTTHLGGKRDAAMATARSPIKVMSS